MLNWRNVSLIFQREVRDQLRDRRTLFMIAVLPLLLYPALGLGMMQLTLVFREQPRTVVILGAENLPSEPPLVEGNRFVERWFSDIEDPLRRAGAAARLVVITDQPGSAQRVAKDDPALKSVQLLERAREIRDSLPDEADGPEAKEQKRQRSGELFGTSGLQVLVIVPPDFGENLERVRSQLASRGDGAGIPTDYPRPEVIFNKADEKSQITFNRVSNVLEKWETAILDDWLDLAKLDKNFTHPVLTEPVDVSLAEQVAAGIWSKLFPALLVIMSVTGAFYPAIDLVAGEKERGTMETLLICPATRTEIVLGKFFTVFLFSCTTALLNLTSMGLTGKHIAGMAPSGVLSQHDVGFPPLTALIWVVAILLPLAALFSALCLALATFARSSKEGQYYLTPLLMVTLGLTMFCLSPGVDLTPQYSVLPIVGAALLLKGLLLSPLHAGSLYVYVGPVLATSLIYCGLALWWAIDQFKREDVLFREGERFELRLWVRHLLRDKEPTPSFSEAGFCFVVIMLLQFFSARFLKERIPLSNAPEYGSVMMQLMIVQQLAIIASPALMMGVMLTTSVRNTFRINWPGWKMLGTAALLPFVLHPVSVELLGRLKWFFGELPLEARHALATMVDPKLPIWFVLLTFAVAPAFCEEIAFRGFVLSGFGRRGRVLLAVGLSSVAFGIMHMVPEQVFNASIMGLVLGTLAVRSNSLIPCVLFHFLNNSLGVLHGRFGAAWYERVQLKAFFDLQEGVLRYRAPALVVCMAIAAPLLWWLFRPLLAGERVTEPANDQDENQPGSADRDLQFEPKALAGRRD